MSYCRFSCDDYQCDVYVYEDVNGGYTTHVAKSRIVFNEPLPEKASGVEDWIDRSLKVMKIVERSQRMIIGLPYDGRTFNDEDAEECAYRLISLKDAGYNVPQYAIENLLSESEADD